MIDTEVEKTLDATPTEVIYVVDLDKLEVETIEVEWASTVLFKRKGSPDNHYEGIVGRNRYQVDSKLIGLSHISDHLRTRLNETYEAYNQALRQFIKFGKENG